MRSSCIILNSELTELKLIHKLDDFLPRWHGGALTIGNFDGVHQGHAKIARRLNFWAEQVYGPATVFTFEPHPVRLLRPEQAPTPLTWIDRKAELLAELGIDVLVAFPTSNDLLNLNYRDFFQSIVVEKIGAKAMVEGPNFFFGNQREGDINRLTELCVASNIKLEILAAEEEDQAIVSSSRIRECVRQGEIDSALSMLTRPYRIRGMVTHGAGRGANLGFATANLDAIDTLVPAAGVYAGFAIVERTQHDAAIHIGPNPTFGESANKVEVHLLDFDRSLYGQVLEVDFVTKIRDVVEFESVEQLKQQLENDVGSTRRILKAYHGQTS